MRDFFEISAPSQKRALQALTVSTEIQTPGYQSVSSEIIAIAFLGLGGTISALFFNFAKWKLAETYPREVIHE